ncbi:MAG: transglutaminase domain-containing protein [Verrucomicrobiae bacterium]|nr:transglutaminase domain-containing protein [Verrucomicrobiae bacterium]
MRFEIRLEAVILGGPMTGALCRLIVALALLPTMSFARTDAVLAEAERLELAGRFREAALVLSNALHQARLSAARRATLEFELDRLDRIRKDFPLTQEALFEQVRNGVRDVTREEFDRWLAEGRFDSRVIDGETRFMRSSLRNLFYRHPELESRRVKASDPGPVERARLETCRAVTRAAQLQGTPYVLPKRFHVQMIVTAKPDAAPDGALLRCWLPIPRAYPFQRDFKLLAADPAVKKINPPDSPIRAAYLEQRVRADAPTRFRIEYEYTASGVRFLINPDAVRRADPNDRRIAPWLREGPHVEFTPGIRALSAQIVGNETHPYRIAKRCYDWIAANIRYSLAIEYSTIRNISEYCRARGYGDCGQEALLFITLCRLNGIPARWQSGWNTFPNADDIHDWTEIWLDPYGWVPVDPYMGIWATQYVRTLGDAEKREIHEFYFGGLDPWRMAANRDHCQPLRPRKRSPRSDNVDFQRGELEWDGRNVYFDRFTYEFTVREIPPPEK